MLSVLVSPLGTWWLFFLGHGDHDGDDDGDDDDDDGRGTKNK